MGVVHPPLKKAQHLKTRCLKEGAKARQARGKTRHSIFTNRKLFAIILQVMQRTKAMNAETFFNRDTEELAQALLGKLLLIKNGAEVLGGYITETEAYLGVTDRACHSYGGNRTPKVEALYANAGTVYIYTIHTHKMLNIVACAKDNPQAVLIRAVEPVCGISVMEKKRGRTGVELTNGPGKLTKAMGINDSII